MFCQQKAVLGCCSTPPCHLHVTSFKINLNFNLKFPDNFFRLLGIILQTINLKFHTDQIVLQKLCKKVTTDIFQYAGLFRHPVSFFLSSTLFLEQTTIHTKILSHLWGKYFQDLRMSIFRVKQFWKHLHGQIFFGQILRMTAAVSGKLYFCSIFNRDLDISLLQCSLSCLVADWKNHSYHFSQRFWLSPLNLPDEMF